MKVDGIEVQTFGDWWETNGPVYETIGVNKKVAHAIWTSAINSMQNAVTASMLKGGL